MGFVLEWRRHWMITIEWEQASDSPFGCKVLEKRCDTPAELRHYVNAARRDRWVIRFPYRSVRALEGEYETHCPQGHALDGNSANRAKLEFRKCACDGHVVLLCKVCEATVIDPTPDEQCDLVLAPGTARDRSRPGVSGSEA